MLKHDLEVTRERLQKEIAGLQKELNKESKKVDKAVMDLGLLEFRVATAEQEKITLDQRIQAHKAELKQQQAFIAKLEAEKAEIANIVNKTRDELTAAKKPPTLSRDKPSTLHDPGPDLVTCKEGLETGGGTIFSSELSLVSIEFLDFGGRIQEK